jgi:Trk K+ transport system NAD-binding subunit
MKQLESAWRDYHMKHLANHDIIVSDTETLESILTEYAATKRKFVVVNSKRIENFPNTLQALLEHSNFLQGLATRDEVLEQAGIKNADTILIATNDDSFNLYVLVTANALNPKIKKVVRINHTENASKFMSVGADSVIPASSIVGQMMSQASFDPCSHRFLVALHTHTHDPFLEDVMPGETDVGMQVKTAFPRAVALHREGKFVYDLEDEKVKKGDIIIRIHLKYNTRGGEA